MWVEAEVEGIDSVDLGKAGALDAPLDRALDAAVLLGVAERVDDLERREVLLGGALDQLLEAARHARQSEPAELVEDGPEIDLFFRCAHTSTSVGASPGSRVGCA